MARYVSHIFCFTELGCRKDSLAFWQAVESGLGVPMARIAMVGDSLEQDARAPRRLGVQRVWFKPDGAATEVSDVPMVDRLATFAQWVREAAAPKLDIELPARPPVLCAGCPHRGSFYACK